MTLQELEERLRDIHEDMHADEPPQENPEPCMCPMALLLGELSAFGVQVPVTRANPALQRIGATAAPTAEGY